MVPKIGTSGKMKVENLKRCLELTFNIHTTASSAVFPIIPVISVHICTFHFLLFNKNFKLLAQFNWMSIHFLFI